MRDTLLLETLQERGEHFGLPHARRSLDEDEALRGDRLAQLVGLLPCDQAAGDPPAVPGMPEPLVGVAQRDRAEAGGTQRIRPKALVLEKAPEITRREAPVDAVAKDFDHHCGGGPVLTRQAHLGLEGDPLGEGTLVHGAHPDPA